MPAHKVKQSAAAAKVLWKAKKDFETDVLLLTKQILLKLRS